jgi:hypothetical protein
MRMALGPEETLAVTLRLEKKTIFSYWFFEDLVVFRISFLKFFHFC